jgi:hypothetical protein
MQFKPKYALIGVAAMLVLAATHARAQVVIAGSSALYLESGQASAASQGCAWDSGSTKDFTLNDARPGLPGEPLTDMATGWVTWQPSTAGDCSTTFVSGSVVIYLSTDSTVGNRCFFARPQCTVTVSSSVESTSGASPTPGGDTLPGVTESTMPSGVLSAISGASVSVSATDIRPEDANFATKRALASCGYPITTGSQYLGLGYTNGSTIIGSSHQTSGTGGAFNVADWNLQGTDPFTGTAVPSTWVVTPVAATPVVVFVNPGNGSGLGNLLISNVNRIVLAGFLDGTYGRTSDIIPQQYSTSGLFATTVYIREPLSGTFNTMEYNIPNSIGVQSSQEIGVAAINAAAAGLTYPPYNCTNYPPTATGNTWSTGANPLTEEDKRGSLNSWRARAIGTGNMVKAVLATTDSLGYAFWSAANFANATPESAKYLTVDGVDPIQEVWTDGTVPTSGNNLLGDVTMSHVKDGSYPIWSIQRFVSLPDTAGNTVATSLAADLAKFLGPSQPDFVPLSQMAVLRSHFSPPTVSYPGYNGTNGLPANSTNTSVTEAGGDVGGLILTQQSDGDYNLDNDVNTGNVNRRQ